MPLFFIIAIGLGAATVGATTVDVTSDMRAHDRDRAAQVQQVQPSSQQAAVYQSQQTTVMR